ncbi:MAG: hypothetical protein KatS3mg092_0430 [Patescibacteria group bacterium]|nr:MAG: hypothetical protein KatS3mg092_0430 [Patescibacteria group bacterium]
MEEKIYLKFLDFIIKIKFQENIEEKDKKNINKLKKIWIRIIEKKLGQLITYENNKKNVVFEINFVFQYQAQIFTFKKKFFNFYFPISKQLNKRKILFYALNSSENQFFILLNQVFYSLIANIGGLTIHGSAIIDKDNYAYIFLAKNGGGKSTIAKLLSKNSKYQIFCDDVFYLIPKDNHYFVYQSIMEYLKKDLKKNIRGYFLKKIFFIKKSKKNCISLIKDKNIIINNFYKQVFSGLVNQKLIILNTKKFLEINEKNFFILKFNLKIKNLI